MRRKVIAGNWKMNNDAEQSVQLINTLLQKLPQTHAEVVIAPSFVNLALAVEKTKNSPIIVAAQNMHFAEKGAFTGEVSASMLEAIGIKTTILGHSERREYFNETDESLAKKVDTALAHHFRIIFCIGEKLAERKAGKHFEVVKGQIEKALFHLPQQAWTSIILAYEPVWAIGTGETATPEQAQEIHAFIRKIVADKYGKTVADDLSILYGGSCNAKNAASLFANPDVDGGLIGGAALIVDDFITIIQAMK
ncbi:triose-phosphate isomerase [Capnocytophaga sp. oral taxon 338]|uniref:triose-phosphate isomerase n=1 Tax=Capnocytophaga sp. oral taxon 338 TaxID=710239 RepID=UPI000202E505|nr:triose-phosphate isomerase [Capnocytophaga sp. oral taxon 338]EGD33057.1 triose-phosphate isomerase [Capnocytophaga sp. oral taxon 338 str. F0234]